MGLPRALGGRSAWLWAVLVLLALELVATGLDLAFGPHDRLHWEEALNARAGMLIACGHLAQTWDLQYQPFCGGCTADALLGAGLFTMLPPTVQTFKLIPATMHIALLLAGTALAWRAAGGRGALAFLALMLGSPSVFRRLSLIGWGNHAESMVFPVLAAWLLSRAAKAPRPALEAGLAGVVAGLGAWYCYTSAHALPVLLLLALWRPRGLRLGAVFAGGGAAGLSPWWAYLAYHPSLLETLPRPESAHLLPTAGELLTFIAGPGLLRGLWPSLADPMAGAAWGGLYWYGLWLLVPLGLVAALRLPRPRPGEAASSGPEEDPGAARRAILYGPLALGALIAAYVWRHGAWYWPSGRLTTDFLGLRYLSPLLPLLALCAAATQARTLWRPLRNLALGVVLVLGAGGLALRAREWTEPRERRLGRSVTERDAPSGPTLSQSPAALVAHLAGATDEPLLCRRDHLIELAGTLCRQGSPPSGLAEVLSVTRSPSEAQDFLDPCLQQVWGERWREPGSCNLDTWRTLLEATCAPLGEGCAPWRAELAAAILRAAPQGCARGGGRNPAVQEDPALRAARCRLLGEGSVSRLGDGRRGPGERLRHAPACAGELSFGYGAGRAWAKRFGCGADAQAKWERAGGSELGETATVGLTDGCAIYAPEALWP